MRSDVASHLRGTPALMAYRCSTACRPTSGDVTIGDLRRRRPSAGSDGTQRMIEWLDSPAFNCSRHIPVGGGALTSTSGANDFVARWSPSARRRSQLRIHGRASGP